MSSDPEAPFVFAGIGETVDRVPDNSDGVLARSPLIDRWVARAWRPAIDPGSLDECCVGHRPAIDIDVGPVSDLQIDLDERLRWYQIPGKRRHRLDRRGEYHWFALGRERETKGNCGYHDKSESDIDQSIRHCLGDRSLGFDLQRYAAWLRASRREMLLSHRDAIRSAYAGDIAAEDARDAVEWAIGELDRGTERVAEKVNGSWVVNEWAKEAILLYFSLRRMETVEVGAYEYHDKIPLKKGLAEQGVRVVPPGTIRYGAHCEPGVIVMPGYVNIGAYVGSGTMVDTWATVGSCAQIGRNVHLSGGVGIGGVLEPPGARPVIIEDGAFIGSRSIVVEGTIVEEKAVLGANTVLTRSTPIIDVTGPEPVEYRGRVPAGSVVVPGTRPKDFPSGSYDLVCALIIGKRTEATDEKTALNDYLRDLGVQL